MKKIDINKYSGLKVGNDYGKLKYIGSELSKPKSILKITYKALLTMLIIFVITGLIVSSAMAVYISGLVNNSSDYDLRAAKLGLTSFIYAYDENGSAYEYQRVYNVENRVWVDYQDIPAYMKDAMVAIEDKRFYAHQGVDIIRTTGAVLNLVRGKSNYGGSTLTQQLIKNLTEDDEVSIVRKIREIFRAVNFERKYSKDEILETYLNVVNFGNGCRGVQAAANSYFGKEIKDCSAAECAAIAGITQNPAEYNPLVNPENNKARREIVLAQMYDQEKLSVDEYNQAMEESENMKFVDHSEGDDEKVQTNPARNWYVEALVNDVAEGLSKELKIGRAAAEQMLLTQGLKIYAAVDSNAQSIAESVIKDKSVMPTDEELELGYVMMGYDGRILATLGCREEKTGDLWFDKANQARRQPGSTIKPIAVYAPAIDLGMYNYSSIIPDEPLSNIDITGNGDYTTWPNNWYSGYKGNVTLQWAIEKSANAPAAQVLLKLTPKKSYKFLTEKLGFTSLDPQDATSLAALSTGGTHIGVTVREMTAAFQIFGNGGKYYKPYTYYYVTDKDDHILLDNRNSTYIQSISSANATVMNRLLRNVIVGSEGTGRAANISNWNVVGKTGTTNDDYDSWFIGETPYAVAGIWTGYDNPKIITETSAAIRIWKSIMTKYLSDKESKDYTYDESVVSKKYCNSTGKLSNSGCYDSRDGYYALDNIPEACSTHGGSAASKQNNTSSQSSSSSSSSKAASSSSKSEVSSVSSSN